MRIVERVCIDRADLRMMTDMQLARLGLRMRDRPEAILECVECGHRWPPEIDSGGKLAYDYWVCPAGCNQKQAAAGGLCENGVPFAASFSQP